jgi:hypothetical protein
MSPRVTCTYHCDRCNGHFHSLQALDTHRGEDECIEPRDDTRFVALAEDAKCELNRHVPYTPFEKGNTRTYPPGWEPGDPAMQRVLEPVVVWTMRDALQHMREHFGAEAGRETSKPATMGASALGGAPAATDGSGEGQGFPSTIPDAGGFPWDAPRPWE